MDPVEKTKEEPNSQASYFHRYCRQLKKRPLDLLVDDYKPDCLTPDAATCERVYIRLSDAVDETVADDILGLAPTELYF